MKQNHFSQELSGKDLRIAIIAARFNEELTDAMVTDCLEALAKCQVPKQNIKTVRVPGSFELPVMAAEMMEHDSYDAIVCIGIIIRGETTHDRYIAQSVSQCLNQLSVTARVPMIFGVLTTNDKAQAEARAFGGGKKGWEAGMSAVEMALLMKEVRGQK
jgi:6,7-dimethyl-8-ribityllumazine synthase